MQESHVFALIEEHLRVQHNLQDNFHQFFILMKNKTALVETINPLFCRFQSMTLGKNRKKEDP